MGEILNRWASAQALVAYIERQFERAPATTIEEGVFGHPSFELARSILLSKHLPRVKDLQA